MWLKINNYCSNDNKSHIEIERLGDSNTLWIITLKCCMSKKSCPFSFGNQHEIWTYRDTVFIDKIVFYLWQYFIELPSFTIRMLKIRSFRTIQSWNRIWPLRERGSGSFLITRLVSLMITSLSIFPWLFQITLYWRYSCF